jgi:hypothetical protein
MPVEQTTGGQFRHRHFAEFGEDVSAGDAGDAVRRLAAATAIVLQIIRHRLRDDVGPIGCRGEPGGEALLVAAPRPRGALRLRETFQPSGSIS